MGWAHAVAAGALRLGAWRRPPRRLGGLFSQPLHLYSTQSSSSRIQFGSNLRVCM
jgi:hypothetical protein